MSPHSHFSAHAAGSPDASGRRHALVILVNTVVGAIGAGLAALLGAFALRPASAAGPERWIRAGHTLDLKAGVPVPRVLSFLRADGWYRERARETVFLVWDGGQNVRAMSATCTHLGCQVRWEAEARRFHCPCHGGVYDASGRVLEGPPPRPLDTLEARLDGHAGDVLVRL